MLKKIVTMIAIMMFGLVGMVSAAVMTFDDLNINPDSSQEITEYQGFDFNNASVINTEGQPADSGYLAGCISPHNVL